MKDTILCIGGPLDGQRATDYGMFLNCQCEDTHRNIIEPLIPQLRPCLELEEIKALTGSSGHREPKFLKEDFERRDLLMKRYSKRRFFMRRSGATIAVYVLEGMSDDAAELQLRVLYRASA